MALQRILTVDDGVTNRRLLRALLEAEAFAVLEAGDGVEALAALEREPVDAIISDVLMPNMDGFRLCLEVRKHARFGALPFIIYTSSYDSASDRKLALDAGADDYLVKPAPVGQILRALARAEARAASHAGRPAPTGSEVDVIKQYNAALVAKLEERNAELSARNVELRASEERFRQLAESIDEVFWLTDPEKQVMLYVSPAYEAIWGRSVASVLQSPRTWLEAVHPEDRARIAEAKGQQSRSDYDEEYRIVRPDGAIRWIRDRAFAVRDGAGHAYRIAGVAGDITDRKQLEEQFRQAQKMEAVGQLAGGVAHDFNNLLCVILMRASIMDRERKLSPDIDEGLTEIHDAATRASNLTRQLLMFSRKQAMQVRRIDLNDVVRGVFRMIRRIVGEHLDLELRDAPGPLPVRGDVGMLEQVVMNLVVNARDATPRGGRVVLAADEVVLDDVAGAARPHAQPGRFVRLTVTDTGMGIAATVLPHIFEPFFTTKEVGHGSGLGLATVYGIVQQHDGWIDVQTSVGHGTSFMIHLPYDESPPDEPAAAAPRAGAMRGNETILLVEDDPALRRTMVSALTHFGYQVLEAGSGGAALELWRKHQAIIKLLLVDLVLPGGMSGREVGERMRRDVPLLGIIYSTGYERDMGTGRPTRLTGVDYLTKPFTVEQLGTVVRQTLDRHS